MRERQRTRQDDTLPYDFVQSSEAQDGLLMRRNRRQLCAERLIACGYLSRTDGSTIVLAEELLLLHAPIQLLQHGRVQAMVSGRIQVRLPHIVVPIIFGLEFGRDFARREDLKARACLLGLGLDAGPVDSRP